MTIQRDVNDNTAKLQNIDWKIERIQKANKSRTIPLILEALILLLHFPGFLGMAWFENVLVAVRTFLVNILWPADAAAMDTYKGIIYNVCTWFKELVLFDLLVQVLIYLLPVLTIWGILRIKMLRRQKERLLNPPPPKPMVEEKEEKGSKHKKVSPPIFPGGWVDPLSGEEIRAANDYCDRNREKYAQQNDFDMEPGLRIQYLVGASTRGTDYVIPWDRNGNIDLSAVFGRPTRGELRRGKVQIYTKDQHDCEMLLTNLKRYEPWWMCGDADDDGTAREEVVITWLGG